MKTQSRASAATKLISIVAYFVITLLCEPLRCSAANPIKPIANTGMTIPVDGGKKFTSFGKEPSQDAAHQGDVAFTAIGAINQPPQPPGSAAAVIIYSDFLQAFVNPPVGETDKTVSGFKFASFDDRISFDHSLVAFRGVLQSNPKASGVFSWSSPGVITAVSPASYSRTVGLSQINTISATGFSPSFDNGTELGNTTLVPDLFWAYYYFNGTVTNDANHDTVHTAQDANDLYVEKNSMVRIKQLSSDFSSVRLHADGGNVAMYGGPGVSVLVGGTPNTVADASTPDPSAQLQPFTSFSPNTSDASPAFQKGRIAFHGANRSSGQLGIYFEDLGDMTKISPANTPLIVADKSSPIPDGGVNFDGTPKRFTTFEKQTCIDGSLIAFVGGRANPPGSPTPYDTKGIYVSQISSTGQPGAPVKVVDLTTKLDFGDTTGTGDTTPKAPMDLSIGHEALVGNKIVFWAEYDATHSGIFIAEVDNTSTPQPIVTVEPAGDGAWNTSTPAAFRIERTGSIAAPLTVTFTHTGGTADSANYDVAPQIDSVRFNPGDTSKLVTITPHNTSITDAQTVLLTITGGGTSYQIGSPASAVVTIFPDAPPPSDAWLLFGNDNITSTSFLGSKAGNLNPVVIKIGGDEKIRIDTAGKLSIGTSASKGSMDVNGRASMTGFRLNKLPDGQTGFVNGYVLTSQDDQGNGAWSGTAAISITGNAASATTAKDFLNSLDGDVTGTQTHTVVSSFGGKHAADFWQLGGNDTSMSKMQNKLFLGTSDLDNSPLSIVTHGIERMHIDADPDGNVGIGTPNPHAKLEIKSGFDTEVLRFGHSDGDYHSISTSFHGSTPAFNYLGFNLESNTSDIRRVFSIGNR